MVLNHDSDAVDESHFATIADTLTTNLNEDTINKAAFSQQLTRQAKHFTFPANISFKDDENNNLTIMEVIAYDQPGLLSRIGTALSECEVQLANAKIATYGERAEDIFMITNENNLPINETLQNCLRKNLEEALSN